MYVKEDIASNLVASEETPIEVVYVELILSKDKWLINSSFSPHKNLTSNHIDALTKALDLHSSKYGKIILLGDFNVAVDELYIRCFCDSYSLENSIKHPISYKNP